MTDSLTKISLIISAVGIIALFFVANSLQPLEITAKTIDKSHVGTTVSVNGTIKSLAVKEGNIFISLEEGMRVVVFRNSAAGSDYGLKRNDRINVVGKVQLYKNELEIVAEKITKLN